MTEEQERKAFEAWRRKTTTMNPDAAVALHGLDDDAPYANKYTAAMYAGWQARASLPDSPVARAFVDGNDMVRELRWMPDMPSFDIPVGTKLYTHPAPHPVGSAKPAGEVKND